MPGDVGLDAKLVKTFFFDRQAVKDRVDAASRRGLSKFGAFTRRTARRFVRRAKGISEPLKPPHSHTELLRSRIFFAYDPERKSVVIGPEKLNSVREPDSLVMLEIGGKTYRTLDGKRVAATYRPRPFMRPAFELEKAESLPRILNQMG